MSQPSSIAAIAGALLLACALQPGSARALEQDEDGATATSAQTGPKAPYLAAGDRVEARYTEFRRVLTEHFERLQSAVDRLAPDLAPKLIASPPRALTYGYQVLPRIVADLPAKTGPQRVIATSFSWPLTLARIEKGERKVAELDAAVRGLDAARDAAPRRKALEDLVDRYVALLADGRLMESNVQYNRLWQHEIANARETYDRNTSLYEAAMEHQRVLDRLVELGDGDSSNVRASIDAEVAELRAREQELRAAIQTSITRLAPPDFLRMEQIAPEQWVVRVPLVTDVEDEEFLAAFRRAVEGAWHVVDGAETFRVVLDLRPISAAALYERAPACDASDAADACRVPTSRERIDVAAHAARFPRDSAILTTGANLTHVNGRSIRLGPQDIAPNVLAHEFGHLLGFVDGYFRGYHDLDEDGYEVLEVVIDPADIMSAPGYGRVQRSHFERLVRR